MAFTDKYVTVAGGGNSDGDSWGNAYTWAEMIADSAAERRYNIEADTYSFSSTQTLSTSGGVSTPICFITWDATHDHIARDFTELAVLDFTGGGNGLVFSNNYALIHGVKVQNGAGVGFDLSGDYIRCTLLESNNNGGTGFLVDRYAIVSLCRAIDNSGDGFDFTDFGSTGILCYATGNNANGFTLGGGSGLGEGSMVILSYARDNGSSGLQYGNIEVKCGNGGAVLCTMDAPTHASGFNFESSLGATISIGNILTNGFDAYVLDGDVFEFMCNLYGNTNPSSSTGEFVASIDRTTVDPEYGGIGANDYSVGNAALIDLLDILGSSLNIGAWQGGAAAAPPGGGGGGGGRYLGL